MAERGAERILIADDNDQTVELLEAVLPTWGYHVMAASNGYQALEKVESSRPDLVLLDIDMPGLDGLEVCRRMKSNPQKRSIPVVFVSGHCDIAQCTRTSGADAYLSKPFTLTDLHERITSLLNYGASDTDTPARLELTPAATTTA